MAPPKSGQSLLKALRAEGLRVVEVGDWENHNRNHMGPWGPLHGVMNHHTVTEGSAKTVKICREGYQGLPGPLCHGVITKDGTVHLIGWGRANHAGKGDPDVLRAVIAETYDGSPPVDDQATVDGNPHFIGYECENLGNGEDPWPRVQYVAMVKANVAAHRLYNWTEKSSIAHKEWQPGKSDPRGEEFDPMSKFRSDIKAALALPPGVWTGEETDMPTVPEIVRGMAKTDGAFGVPERWRASNPENMEWKLEAILGYIGNTAMDAAEGVKALEAKVDNIGVGGNLSEAQMERLAELVADKLAQRLAE